MVLTNKLGITNAADLAREEERISKKKALGPVLYRYYKILQNPQLP